MRQFNDPAGFCLKTEQHDRVMMKWVSSLEYKWGIKSNLIADLEAVFHSPGVVSSLTTRSGPISNTINFTLHHVFVIVRLQLKQFYSKVTCSELVMGSRWSGQI